MMNQIIATAAIARTPPSLTRWLDRSVPADDVQSFLQELYDLVSADQDGFSVAGEVSQNLVEGTSELLGALTVILDSPAEAEARLNQAYRHYFAYFDEINFNVVYPNVNTLGQVPPVELSSFFAHDFDKLGQFHQKLNPQERALTRLNILLLNYLRDIAEEKRYRDLPQEISSLLLSEDKTLRAS